MHFPNYSNHTPNNTPVTATQHIRRYAFYLRLWDVHLGLWGNWAQEVVFSTLDSVITFTDVAETFFEVVWQAEPRIVSKVGLLVCMIWLHVRWLCSIPFSRWPTPPGGGAVGG